MSEIITRIHQHVEKMKEVQQTLLNFIDMDVFEESDLDLFTTYLDKQQINKSRVELCSLLHILVQISNNHFRVQSFFIKIDKILLHLKSSIQHNFSKSEIFHIFRSNKRLLLFLFEQNILTPTQDIANVFTTDKYIMKSYPQYFMPEFKSFFPTDIIEQFPDLNLSEESRKIGENDGRLQTLIRTGQIEDFISYIHKNNTQLTGQLITSIYETNSFLQKKDPTLIEYAAFYGSIEIFQYLIGKEVEFDSNLWFYAIHGRNPEIIQYLEENFQIDSSILNKVFNESVKCHHNEIKDYIEQNFDQKGIDKKPNFASFELEKDPDFKQVLKVIKYFNYSYFPDISDCISFEFFCLAQNQPLLELFLSISKFNINSKIEDDTENIFILKSKSLLHFAIEIGNPEIVNFILSFPEIDVNVLTVSDFDPKSYKIRKDIDSHHISPLVNAIELENYEIIQLLLNHPKIDVNQISTYRYYYFSHDEIKIIKLTALFTAIQHFNKKILELILSKQEVDVNAIFEIELEENDNIQKKTLINEMTALNYLIQSEDVQFVNILLTRTDVDVQKRSKTKRIVDFIYPEGYRKLAYYKFTDESGKFVADWFYYQEEYDYYSKGYYKCESYCENEIEYSPLDNAINTRNIEILLILLNRSEIDINRKTKITSYETKYFSKLRKGRSECTELPSEYNYYQMRRGRGRGRGGRGGRGGRERDDRINVFDIDDDGLLRNIDDGGVNGDKISYYYDDFYYYNPFSIWFNDLWVNNISYDYFSSIKIKIKNKYHYEKNNKKIKLPIAKNKEKIKRNVQIREEFILEDFDRELNEKDYLDKDAFESISLLFFFN